MADNSQVSVEELRKSGLVKLKGQDMYSVWVKTACCNLNSTQLVKLADITDKYARGYLLFSTRQTPIIPFVNLNDVDKVKDELAEVYCQLDRCGPTVRNINVCYSDNICADAVTNPLVLAQVLDNFFNVPMSNKVKIGVAGCGKDCIISQVLGDLSFTAVQNNGQTGYDVRVGGRLGVNPTVGTKLAEGLSEQQCVKFTQNYFDLMNTQGKSGERSADLINQFGEQKVRQELTKDLDNTPAYAPIDCANEIEQDQSGKIILKIRATCGEVNTAQLRKIADIAEKYGQGFVHFVVRGAPEIPCVDESDVEDIRKELASVDLRIMDSGIDNLQTCFGDYCTEGNANPQSLLRRVDKHVEQIGLNNPDISVGGSGCPNSCGVAHINDIGYLGVIKPEVVEGNCTGCEMCVPICNKKKAISMVDGIAVIDYDKCSYCGRCITVCFDAIVEKSRGFEVLVGGRRGEDTRLAQPIAWFLSEDEAFELTSKCLDILKEKNTNAATIINEIGLDKFKQLVLSDK
ncbi:MAG: 4Fe-4S binding protein [Chloroflexi bacterium]|jgi:anaerobic sulfite reductase subunit C|nr:4Fe-4S binding protein [Chloroflexota bacterium]MBT7081167.1 4Fe-4S binding protein [Chloroflexota bacterium]MBT7290732.1 4Fe-4S binding protein [Chloroflexota bacterium]